MAATTSTSAMQVARAFGDAYARADLDAVLGLLHPDVHEREVTPGAIVDQHGPHAVVQELADFVSGFDPPEVLQQDVEQTGDLFRWATRWRLRRDGEVALIEWQAFLEVADGRVKRIDVVCTGLMPEPGHAPVGPLAGA